MGYFKDLINKIKLRIDIDLLSSDAVSGSYGLDVAQERLRAIRDAYKKNSAFGQAIINQSYITFPKLAVTDPDIASALLRTVAQVAKIDKGIVAFSGLVGRTREGTIVISSQPFNGTARLGFAIKEGPNKEPLYLYGPHRGTAKEVLQRIASHYEGNPAPAQKFREFVGYSKIMFRRETRDFPTLSNALKSRIDAERLKTLKPPETTRPRILGQAMTHRALA